MTKSLCCAMIVADPSLLPSFPAPASRIASPPFSAQPSPLADHLQSRVYDPLNSRQFILLQPLCSLFSTSVLCFQSLAASFAKKGGGVYPQARGVQQLSGLKSK